MREYVISWVLRILAAALMLLALIIFLVVTGTWDNLVSGWLTIVSYGDPRG